MLEAEEEEEEEEEERVTQRVVTKRVVSPTDPFASWSKMTTAQHSTHIIRKQSTFTQSQGANRSYGCLQLPYGKLLSNFNVPDCGLIIPPPTPIYLTFFKNIF